MSYEDDVLPQAGMDEVTWRRDFLTKRRNSLGARSVRIVSAIIFHRIPVWNYLLMSWTCQLRSLRSHNSCKESCWRTPVKCWNWIFRKRWFAISEMDTSRESWYSYGGGATCPSSCLSSRGAKDCTYNSNCRTLGKGEDSSQGATTGLHSTEMLQDTVKVVQSAKSRVHEVWNEPHLFPYLLSPLHSRGSRWTL